MKTCPAHNIGFATLFLCVAVGLVSGLAADPSPTPSVGPSATASVGPSPSPPPGDTCNFAKWNPELYTFYGAKDNVTDKVSNLPVKLSEHRVFLQITQGDNSGQVKLYEREKNGTFTVTEWQGKDTSQLVCSIDK